jgi:hypothetical protein
VLQRRGLEAPFIEFLLTSAQGMVLLFAILDLPKLRRLEAYSTPELLHHLSTDLEGLSVFLSNSNGLRYATPLSPLLTATRVGARSRSPSVAPILRTSAVILS